MKKFPHALWWLALLCALTTNAGAQTADAAPAMKFFNPSADADEKSDFVAVAGEGNWRFSPTLDLYALMPDGARQTEIVYGPGRLTRSGDEHFRTAQEEALRDATCGATMVVVARARLHTIALNAARTMIYNRTVFDLSTRVFPTDAASPEAVFYVVKEGGEIDEDGNIFRVIFGASPLYADGADYLLFLLREKSRDNVYVAGGFLPVRDGRVYPLGGRTEKGIAPGTEIDDVGRDIASALASTPCR